MTAQLFEEWIVDFDGDLAPDAYHFTRAPLDTEGGDMPDRKALRIVNLHTKSE